MYWTDPGGVEASKEIASSLILRSGCLGCHATREKTGLPEISLICVIHFNSDRSWEVSRHLVTMEVRYSFREASKREPTLETSSCSSDSNFNI